MAKTSLIFKYILNFYSSFFLYSKTENVFTLNNPDMKTILFQNKFYLYEQKIDIWKKNYTNNMNMPEKG